MIPSLPSDPISSAIRSFQEGLKRLRRAKDPLLAPAIQLAEMVIAETRKVPRAGR